MHFQDQTKQPASPQYGPNLHTLHDFAFGFLLVVLHINHFFSHSEIFLQKSAQNTTNIFPPILFCEKAYYLALSPYHIPKRRTEERVHDCTQINRVLSNLLKEEKSFIPPSLAFKDRKIYANDQDIMLPQRLCKYWKNPKCHIQKALQAMAEEISSGGRENGTEEDKRFRIK
ncbi:hypothetical protein EYC84_003445 [Monilinia fructicola]|uniref:Uncharacterized protein n=1 Tax=Monilinia fructicola TaxID=38448 RepID=A0A5M9JW74_MONFR|nr:hypothetical protein EYC84_003445 [Monilinia fructicola]